MSQLNKTISILYLHSNKGQNNYTRGECEAMLQLIKRDIILRTLVHVINADNPRMNVWLNNNEAGIKPRIPGFIIKKPNCLVNEKCTESLVKVLGMGHINIIIRVAFLYYEYLERNGQVPIIIDKMCPIVSFDMPLSLNPNSDPCTVSNIFDTTGVIIDKRPWKEVRLREY